MDSSEWIDLLVWVALSGVVGFVLDGIIALVKSSDKTIWKTAVGQVNGRMKALIHVREERDGWSNYKRMSEEKDGYLLTIAYEVDGYAYKQTTKSLVSGYQIGDQIEVWYKQNAPEVYKVQKPILPQAHRKRAFVDFTIASTFLVVYLVVQFFFA